MSICLRSLFLVIAIGVCGVGRTETARDLYTKAYDQLNGKSQRGRYVVSGTISQSGNFSGKLNMPQSISWSMIAKNSKKEQFFEWQKDKGITTKNEDGSLHVLDNAIGRIAIETLIASLHGLRDPNSQMAKLVTITSSVNAGKHTLVLKPTIPLVDGYVWSWVVVREPKVRVLEWRLEHEGTEYAFIFEGDKK